MVYFLVYLGRVVAVWECGDITDVSIEQVMDGECEQSGNTQQRQYCWGAGPNQTKPDIPHPTTPDWLVDW